jgi:hypothetical protein
MFENTHDEFIENERVFVPDQCHLDYKSNGQGVQCLGKKTIHVWGDANVARYFYYYYLLYSYHFTKCINTL